MGQQIQGWRSASGQRLWLSMLIDTMEAISRPELRAVPCDDQLLAAVRAQLARPALVRRLMPRLTACGTDAATIGTDYSPANCNRGCLPSSIPRKLASSPVM